ncbi:uncharacterized protein NEMAJ01_0200 [Nematocida major]|uniref:uncharacterized protein n=1 Tax=Nematocida major TaxID=1912982 RepID=UPI002008020B|nr:uncharacterized protein NEMAJ01_0200 [Nematocida major]KAH9385304.1 hypothetical protein NEMAJ01_0200 [Nematocida major]
MNLRIPIGFITMIFAVLMSACVFFDLTRHMKTNNTDIIEVLLNREEVVKRQYSMPFANDESNTKRTTSMGGGPASQNCMSFLNEGPANIKYAINEDTKHGNASCFVKDILDPLSKVDLKIYSEQFVANETSEIEIKYKLLDGESMRNNFAGYQNDCIFDNLEPIDENYVEMSRFACFTSEPAYTNFYANIIGDRNFVERKSELLKDKSLKKILYFGWQSCLWSKDYYSSLKTLLGKVLDEKNYRPGMKVGRQVELLGGVAFVYDAVKFNTFSTIEVIISRYQQTLKAFKNDVIQKDDLQKLAAVQLRSDAYSLIDSLMLLEYIAESIRTISKKHVEFVKEGSISAAVAGTREVNALNFSIMDSLNNSTFGKDNIFTKQTFTWLNYIERSVDVIKAAYDEINAAWKSPITSMKEDLEALKDLQKSLKARLGTDQTFILVKGIPLDKVDADSVKNSMVSIDHMISSLHDLYASASKKFEKKISDFCKNKTSDCLADMYGYTFMPDDPMKGKITLENHRSAYEEALAHNDSSPIPASNPGTS